MIMLALLGALLYRLRGGALSALWQRGDVPSRLAWALPTGALCGLLAGSWWVSAVTAITVYLASLIEHGWCQSSDTGGQIDALDAACMSSVVIGIGLAIAVPVYLLTDAVWLPVLAGSALAGPAYWAGWRIESSVPDLRTGTEIGEALTGGAIWAGIIISWGI